VGVVVVQKHAELDVGDYKMTFKVKRKKTEKEKEAEVIVNSKPFKALVKVGFTQRKAFKIMRGY